MCIFFQVEAPVFVASGAWGIASIDIGADGVADFVVADAGTGHVSLLGIDDAGGIGSATSFKVGLSPEGIAVGDLNHDGKSDVVTANAGANTVSVLINNGKGGFNTAVTVAVGKDPTSVTTASVNNENWSDIIVADSGSSQVTVLTSNGAATPKFTAATYSVGSGPDSVVAANLVPHGRPDIITADGGAGEISVLINNGSGGFKAAVNYAVGDGPSSDPMAVTTANLNGDAVPDVIVANGDGSVSVLLNQGNGKLAPAQTFQVGYDLTAIATGNFDNTGTPDILVADASTDSIYVLAYENGGLAEIGSIYMGAPVVSMTLADVNDDGRPDIVATLANGDVEVALNQSDYSAAQAIAAYAANPALTGMIVSDTGANIGANFAGLETLAVAGALAAVTDSDYSAAPITSAQLFADSAVVNELEYVPLALSSGPLSLSLYGNLEATVGSVGINGTLTNTGSLSATTSNGSLTLIGFYEYPFEFFGEFVNAGVLTVGNGYQLTVAAQFANTGSIVVSGGALLDIASGPFSNTGAITVDAATLQIGAPVAVAALGSITDIGGAVVLTGELTGPGVLKVGSGSALGTIMMDGTIANATIVDGGGGMEFFGPVLNPGTGVLQDVTYEGTLGLGLHDDQVSVVGPLTLLGAGGTGPGTIQLTGSAARLNLEGIGALDNATVYIGSAFKADPSVLYAAGRALTFGSSLSVVQVQGGALIEGDLGFGDGIVNDGSISAAVAGGRLVVRGAEFTNNGALTVGNGESVYLDTTQVGNLSGGVLSGGNWEVDGASTLWLPTNAGVGTLAANLTLTGSGSAVPTVAWFSTRAEANVTLQQTLATIATAGVLTLGGAWTYGDLASGGLDVLGKLALAGATLGANSVTIGADGSVSGFGDLAVGTLVNNGSVTASGGLLAIDDMLQGSGAYTIDAGATLDTSFNSSGLEKVTFAANSGMFEYGQELTANITVTGFAKGTTIDLKEFVESSYSYSVSSHTLTIDSATSSPIQLTFAGAYSKGSFHFASDGNGGTLLTDPSATVVKALSGLATSPDLILTLPGAALPAGGMPVASTTSPDPLGSVSGLPDGVRIASPPAIPVPGHS